MISLFIQKTSCTVTSSPTSVCSSFNVQSQCSSQAASDQNILVVSADPAPKGRLGFLIKLADFGLAYWTHPKAAKEDRVSCFNHYFDRSVTNRPAKRPRGHLAYTAPELANRKDRGGAVDAYSAGVIFYQMQVVHCSHIVGHLTAHPHSQDKIDMPGKDWRIGYRTRLD